jgi:hypothetical protein
MEAEAISDKMNRDKASKDKVNGVKKTKDDKARAEAKVIEDKKEVAAKKELEEDKAKL